MRKETERFIEAVESIGSLSKVTDGGQRDGCGNKAGVCYQDGGGRRTWQFREMATASLLGKNIDKLLKPGNNPDYGKKLVKSEGLCYWDHRRQGRSVINSVSCISGHGDSCNWSQHHRSGNVNI